MIHMKYQALFDFLALKGHQTFPAYNIYSNFITA